jgi:hypothetical protein
VIGRHLPVLVRIAATRRFADHRGDPQRQASRRSRRCGPTFFGVVGAAIAAAGSGGVSAETLHDGARHASIWSATASNPARATPLAVPKSMLCGRNKCNDCSRFDCAGQPYGDLDRNGGKPDVIRCPPHFDEAGFIEYPPVNWSCTSTARGRA